MVRCCRDGLARRVEVGTGEKKVRGGADGQPTAGSRSSSPPRHCTRQVEADSLGRSRNRFSHVPRHVTRCDPLFRCFVLLPHLLGRCRPPQRAAPPTAAARSTFHPRPWTSRQVVIDCAREACSLVAEDVLASPPGHPSTETTASSRAGLVRGGISPTSEHVLRRLASTLAHLPHRSRREQALEAGLTGARNERGGGG